MEGRRERGVRETGREGREREGGKEREGVRETGREGREEGEGGGGRRGGREKGWYFYHTIR